MFRDARARVLPAAIKSLYAAARGRFEQGDLKTAATQFRDVIGLLSEGQLVSDPSLSDIKLLAEGFVRLADQQLAAAATPVPAAPTPAASAPAASAPAASAQAASTPAVSAPAASAPGASAPGASAPGASAPGASAPGVRPPAAPAPSSAPPPSGDAASRPPDSPTVAPPGGIDQRIYSAADGEVVPPVPIDQAIPQWVPPAANYRYQEFSGVLDIVVDEAGTVVSASMSQRLNVVYDQLLIRAAKRWRYRPAQRAGKPVKYRKQLNIVLRPDPAGTEPIPIGQPRIPEVR
jgi:hypothetical protein